MSTLNATDLFAVRRGSQTYKVSYQDVLAGVVLPSVLTYMGATNPAAAAPAPAGGLKAGMTYVLTPGGKLAAGWTGIAGINATDGQLTIWEGAKWELIGNAGAIPQATETVSGIVELATAAETTTGTDATRAVHPAGLKVELDKKAPLASPALTGTPTAPTAAAGTNTTQLATTAFVTAAVTAEDLWDRTGTEISPKTAGDSVFTSGAVKVGGTTAAPNITLTADGSIAQGQVGSIGQDANSYYIGANFTGTGVNFKKALNAQRLWFDPIHDWLTYSSTAAPGTAGGPITFTNRFVVDQLGNFLIGGTLPASPNITLKADGTITAVGTGATQAISVSKTGKDTCAIGVDGSGYPAFIGAGNYLSLRAGGFDAAHTRAMVAQTGDFLLGGTLPASPNVKLEASGSVRISDGIGWLGTAAGYLTYINKQGNNLVAMNSNSATGVMLAQNANAWAPFVSESRLKDIQSDADADQCWNLIRDIELKRYFYKDQDDKSGVSYMGPMADWLGLQDPELLIDTGRTDEHGPIHTYNQGLLDMKALAALSAALKRIEALETRLAALEPAKTPTP